MDNDGQYDDADGDLVSVPLPELLAMGLDRPGNFPVSLRVTDAFGAYGFANTWVVIANQAPVASAGGPYYFAPDPMFEIGLMPSVTDADDQPFDLSYEWDLDLDGQFGDVVGEMPLLSFADLTSFGATLPQNTIRLRVTDTFGAVDIAEADVVVEYPSPIVVTSTLDVIDPTNDDTELTLREAIQQANTQVGPFVIELPAGHYMLTLARANEDANATGDLDILDDLVIVGAGTQQTIIDASAIVDRVFDIESNRRVTLHGVTITGGQLLEDADDGSNRDDGAAILNGGRLTLTSSEVVGNAAPFGSGGGIFNAGGSLAVVRTTIADNSAACAEAELVVRRRAGRHLRSRLGDRP